MAVRDRIGRARIRVLIVDVPGLLASVIRETLTDEPDMEVVEQYPAPAEVGEALMRSVDVVVTTPAAAAPARQIQAILFGPCPKPVVAVSGDGMRVDVYGHSAIHGTGLKGLTTLIRAAATSPGMRTGGA